MAKIVCLLPDCLIEALLGVGERRHEHDRR
jgi:hypothetical protein